MLRLLIYIKHHLSFIWFFIEWLNSVVFQLLYGRILNNNLKKLLETYQGEFNYRFLQDKDVPVLADFFSRQPEEAFKFFKPHGFDVCSLRKKIKDCAFIMVGAFQGEKMVGYCFLRCFFNKHAFRGKIVDVEYQGRGIAKQMGKLMTDICLLLNFRVFATISKKNVKSMASSQAVNRIRIIKELPDDYLYVEYLLKDNMP